LLSLAAFYAFRWPFTPGRVSRSIETSLPVKVTYAKFRSTYFPHAGCVAEGVQFHWLASKPGAPPIAEAASIKIRAHYWDLVLRPGYLAHITLKGLRIDVPSVGTPREPYQWQETPSHIRIGEIIADGAVLQVARGDGEPPLLFDICSSRLTAVSRHEPFSYSVALRNPLPPGYISAHGTFGPWNSSDPGSTQLSGDYTLHNADLSVFHGIAGTLFSEDRFGGPLQRIEARGRVDIPDFRVTHSSHSVHLATAFHAFINGLNGDIQLENVAAAFLRTKVSAQGTIAGTPGAAGKTTLLDLSATQGRIQDVLRLFVSEPTPPLNGTTSFRAHVIWPPGRAPFLQKVRVIGDFGIVGGQFSKTATQEDVADLSARARGEKPNEENDDKDAVVSNLSGHVELRNEIASFSNFSFTVPGASAQMHGTYNLENHAVDLHGLLMTDAEFSHMTTGFKSVLLKPFNIFFKKRRAGAVVPAHLVGTYEHPQPGVDVVSKGSGSPPEKQSPVQIAPLSRN